MSGLYIHIPYCRKACHYCDFHFSTTLTSMPDMVKALCVEIEIRGRDWKSKDLDSLYFGGGTPSILPTEFLEQIFKAVKKAFRLKPSAEITLEANPDDIHVDTASVWKSLGINRLSIGLQSSHDQRLTWMNRIHSVGEGQKAVEYVRKAGIENISLDLIYNFPDGTLQELDEDLTSLLSLDPNHISAYGLTIEPQTVFGKRFQKGQLFPLPEESAVMQFQYVYQRLTEAGFEGYEISNFGKPGFYAVHNTNYWFQKPYLGIGPGAHGFDGSIRTENYPNNALYIKSLLEKQQLHQKVEILSREESANEFILTRLRTKWGLDLNELASAFGIRLEEVHSRTIESMVEKNLLLRQNTRLILSQEGKLLADRMALELMI